jgi:RimJ/RimL family protein N-acetyltransferase
VEVTLRQATLDDVPFLAALAADPGVEPFLAVSRSSTPEAIAERIIRAEAAPDDSGVVVIEVDGRPAGTMTWELANRRSRIASVGGFAVDPTLRGRGVGLAAARALQRYLFGERGFHRLQMEVYGFNERGIRHAERAGWVREGVRRRAYWRNDTWVDGVLFGLLEDEVDDG